MVQEGIVERVTGAGKVVVEPAGENADLKVGDEVMIVTSSTKKPEHEVTLETLKARVTSPFPSNWTIIVRANRRIDRCSVYTDATQLRALDSDGVSRSELPLPPEGVLNFRIPENVNVSNESIVEVRDGDRSVLWEKFGSIGATMTTKEEPYATEKVTISGKLSPLNKVDVHRSNVVFTNAATGRKFSAAVTNGQYSVLLPNHESYRVSVIWDMTPGTQTSTAQAGTLNLNVNTQAYTFDISW
jgi:hypothetical protein